MNSQEILQELDASHKKYDFIILDGGKEIPCAARMATYRSNQSWAMVMEQLSYHNNSPGLSGLIDCVHKIGPGFKQKNGRALLEELRVIADADDEPVFSLDDFQVLNPKMRSVKIRNEVVPVDLSLETLRAKGIPLPDDGPLSGEHLLWSLLPKHKDALLCNRDERQRGLPVGLSEFLVLDEWNHPPLISRRRSKPSDSETFQMLAEAIASGDPNRYRPTAPPNTDWRNWLHFERV